MMKPFILSLFVSLVYSQITTPGYVQSVQLSAVYPSRGSGVTLQWQKDTAATAFEVSRKARSATTWTVLSTLPDSAVSFHDSTLVPGAVMEYRVVCTRATGSAWGYLLAGREKAAVLSKGRVALVVEDRIDTLLSDVVTRLCTDLAGEGWRVSKFQVKSNDSVTVIRRNLANLRQADTVLKCVFLLGSVPVPYSGNLNPDGHSDHLGAWPADAYYGELNSAWTDNTVNSTAASRPQNDNIPGDGKFDQSYLPSALEIGVGRVDFSRMSQFGVADTVLIRRYLDKDHAFRNGLVEVVERGLVDDNFTGMAEGFSQGAWRGFPALVPRDSVYPGDFFTLTGSATWLLAYGCGGGSFTSCGGVGSTSDFVTKTVSAVLVPLFGSYFGDFDSDNNLLRAAIAAEGLTLATLWSGRPNAFMHTLGMGETFGEMAKLTQENSWLYQAPGYGANGVHTALMGDPTLTLYPCASPSSLNLARLSANLVRISWQLSPDTAVQGYSVERADSLAGAWALLTSPLSVGATFDDAAAPARSVVYRVRAQKLKTTPSGSFWQASVGIMDSIGTANLVTAALVPSNPLLTVLTQPFGRTLTLGLNLPQGKSSLCIADVRGRVVWKADFRAGERGSVVNIDTGRWARGLYFASLISVSGRASLALAAQ